MKKAVKGIIGLSAVLVVLGGGYAALRFSEPKDDPGISSGESSDTQQQAVVLVYDDKVSTDEDGVVVSVDVVNQTDTLHVVQKTAKTDSSAATFTLDGYQDIAMRDSVIGTLANNANGLTSQDVIEEDCQDLAKFGLDEPLVTVDLKYETGTECRFFIGNEAPSGGVTYVRVDGRSTVYTVSSSTLANYSNTLYDFVDKTVLAEPDQDNYPIVKSLKIEREDIDYDILLEYDSKSDDDGYTGGSSATHVMVEPTDAYLSVERSTEITTGMFGLSASGIYSLHCKESDIAEAGLKDPFCTVTMSCDDGNSYVLMLSEPFTDSENGRCCYAMLEGGNVIYIVTEENAQWVTVMPVDIASRIFIGDYVWNVTDLSVSCNTGDKAEFDISRIDENGDANSLSSADFRVTLNGAEFDSERYRKFYSFLISAAAEDFALGEDLSGRELMAELEYNESYSGDTHRFGFYEYSNLTALVTVDGESKFFIRKSYVQTLIENVQRLNTDEEFKTTWK